MRHIARTALFAILLTSLTASINARPSFEPERNDIQKSRSNQLYPIREIASQNVNQINMMITNFGIFGKDTDAPLLDPFSGQYAQSLTYPKNTQNTYLWGMRLWIGAIVGRDTLVSTAGWGDWDQASEFWPDTLPNSHIILRSTNDRSSPEFQDAVSQQDFECYYCDTLDIRDLTGFDNATGRVHRPIGVKVIQRSYAWGYDYADDFILFDLKIGNITFRDINGLYIGLYVDNDIYTENKGSPRDDIVGFYKTMPSPYIAGLIDTINVAWAADNDGDPNPITGDYQGIYSPTAAAGIKVLRTPADTVRVNFNWWVNDYFSGLNWGPYKRPPAGVPVRYFGGYLGEPRSDADKYFLMANGETDYDLTDAQRDHSADGWLPPPENIDALRGGGDVRYVISSGPFTLGPGDFAPFTFAVVMGQHYHRDWRTPGPTHNLTYLGLNSLWASWIFDNPGIDTDGDGYKGKYHVYNIGKKIVEIDTLYLPRDTIIDTTFEFARRDTLYYEGDGVPDFKGAAPPPAPDFSLIPKVDEFNQGTIEVRWNGVKSETEPDQFSQLPDFEGYRVYVSETGFANGFTMLASYDIENYDRWEYDTDYNTWAINQPPFTLQQLHQLYGENFDPENYNTQDHLFAHYNYSTQAYDQFFFTPHDWNQSTLTDSSAIFKVYPYEPPPPTSDLDSAKMYWPEVLTPEGRFKYYEYRYIIHGLLPSKSYFVSVTVFDHGDPSKGLGPIETNPADNASREYAENSTDLVLQNGLKVVVYPNPYFINGGYRGRYEGWEQDQQGLPSEYTRALHFANLPPKCTIRIFTIDGDLVATVDHDYPPGSPGSMHDQWDMISRNHMAIMSGIYYYSVESEYGNQIGKFVVIM